MLSEAMRSERLDASIFLATSAAALRALLQSGNYSEGMRLPMPGSSHGAGELAVWLSFLRGGISCWDRSRFHERYRSRLTKAKGPAPALLYDLFWLHKAVPESALLRIAHPEVLQELANSGLLRVDDDHVCATAGCFSFLGQTFLFDFDRGRPDFVFFGTDSFIMPRFIGGLFPEKRFKRSLDLCTGSGVQGLFLSRQSDEALCVDINLRAVSFARANALLNNITNVRAVQSNLFANLEGSFDCITANTPYRPMPEKSGVCDLPLRGGDLGIEFTLRLIRELPQYLTDDGIAIIYTSDPVVDTRPVLLPEVRQVLEHQPFRIDEYLLFRSYTDEPDLHKHFRRHNISGYDDCLLVLRKGKSLEVARNVWRPSYYWRTYLRSLAMRRRMMRAGVSA